MSTLSQFFGSGVSGGIGSTFNIYTASGTLTIPSNVRAVAYGVMGASTSPGTIGPFSTPGVTPFTSSRYINAVGAAGGFAWREEKVTLPAAVTATITIGGGGLAAGAIAGNTSISAPGVTTISATGGGSIGPTHTPHLNTIAPAPIINPGTISGGTGSGGNINSSGGNGLWVQATSSQPFTSPIYPLGTAFSPLQGRGGSSAGGLWGDGVSSATLAPPGPSALTSAGGNYSTIPNSPIDKGFLGDGANTNLEVSRLIMSSHNSVSLAKTFFAMTGANKGGGLSGTGGAAGSISLVPVPAPTPTTTGFYAQTAAAAGSGGLGAGGGGGLGAFGVTNLTGRGGLGGSPGIAYNQTPSTTGEIPFGFPYAPIGYPGGQFTDPNTTPGMPGFAAVEYWENV